MNGIMVDRALVEGLERADIDCAEVCLKYFKDGESSVLCESENSTCDSTPPVIIVTNKISEYKF
jgi:hypothetical protein